ncbi:MAG: hypothetical protein GY733_01230 [bacterium]|nr:hypothetical protein [bacterium]
MQTRGISCAALALVLLSAGLAAADAGLDLERLNGRWKLDWARSDSFEPVMKALEVPWLVRKLAGVVPVHVTLSVASPACDSCDPSLYVEQQNPLRSSSRTIVLDGVARPAKDPLGNDTVDRFTWSSENGMEMVRERVLASGKSARIREQRRVEDDLETMISTVTVWVENEERARVRRVLRKVEP